MIENEQFETVTSYEVYDILQDISLDVIEGSLKSQIEKPLLTRTNFLTNIEDIYTFYNEYSEDDDRKSEALGIICELMDSISETIGEVYDFHYNIDLVDSIEDKVETVLAMYKFLILRYKKNISNYIFNYIIKNRKNIAEHFGDTIKKKDVTTISIKRKVKNKDAIIIISNLDAIIKYILSLHCEVDTFIENSSSIYYEAEHVRNMWEMGLIQGSFVQNYFNILLDEYNDILDEIFEDVKLKLINKLNIKN